MTQGQQAAARRYTRNANLVNKHGVYGARAINAKREREADFAAAKYLKEKGLRSKDLPAPFAKYR